MSETGMKANENNCKLIVESEHTIGKVVTLSSHDPENGQESFGNGRDFPV